MLRKKCYTVRELFSSRRVNTVLFLDRMPGWKLLPLLTRSFASRDKDVRSRKRTRVERRETTTRWNTTKRAKVWIVIFFGLVPRRRSRARVPFRNSALVFRSTYESRTIRFDELTKRKIIWNNCETRSIDKTMIDFPRLEIYLVVTRSVLLGFRKRSYRWISGVYETRDQIRRPVDRDPILDLGSLRSVRRATIEMRLDSRWREKGGGTVKNRGVAICYLPFSTFGSNYSSAMRFDSARSGAFSSGRVESRLSICIFLGSRDLDRRDRRRSITFLSRIWSPSPDFDFQPDPILRFLRFSRYSNRNFMYTNEILADSDFCDLWQKIGKQLTYRAMIIFFVISFSNY